MGGRRKWRKKKRVRERGRGCGRKDDRTCSAPFLMRPPPEAPLIRRPPLSSLSLVDPLARDGGSSGRDREGRREEEEGGRLYVQYV